LVAAYYFSADSI